MRRYNISPARDDKRFFSRVKKVFGCWIWIGFRNSYGYGTFSIRHKNVYAHRWSYQRFVGPIPEGLQIDHLCRKPCCVNPHHLEPVTAALNAYRSPYTQQSINRAKTQCIRGHLLSGENILVRGGRRNCRQCRSIYNATQYAKRHSKAANGGVACEKTLEKWKRQGQPVL